MLSALGKGISDYKKGAHTIFKTLKGKITHYETKIPQTNPQNPNPWKIEKRFDGTGKGHYNKELKKKIETPHVHNPKATGKVRQPYAEEYPRGY